MEPLTATALAGKDYGARKKGLSRLFCRKRSKGRIADDVSRGKWGKMVTLYGKMGKMVTLHAT
jgi:hypothetical protein